MIKRFVIFTAAALCMGAVHAERIAALQPATINLGDHTAVVYYTQQGDQYEVVTTIGPNVGTEGSIVRHVTRVRAGESFNIEFGSNGSGVLMRTIAVARDGDLLSVAGGNAMSLAQRN